MTGALNTLQHTATYCNILPHTTTQRFVHALFGSVLHHISAMHDKCSQHTATHCNILQHTATHYNTVWGCVLFLALLYVILLPCMTSALKIAHQAREGPWRPARPANARPNEIAYVRIYLDESYPKITHSTLARKLFEGDYFHTQIGGSCVAYVCVYLDELYSRVTYSTLARKLLEGVCVVWDSWKSTRYQNTVENDCRTDFLEFLFVWIK